MSKRIVGLLIGGVTLPRRRRGFDSAHCCPFKGRVECFTVPAAQPVAAFRGLLVDAEREGRAGVAELLAI